MSYEWFAEETSVALFLSGGEIPSANWRDVLTKLEDMLQVHPSESRTVEVRRHHGRVYYAVSENGVGSDVIDREAELRARPAYYAESSVDRTATSPDEAMQVCASDGSVYVHRRDMKPATGRARRVFRSLGGLLSKSGNEYASTGADEDYVMSLRMDSNADVLAPYSIDEYLDHLRLTAASGFEVLNKQKANPGRLIHEASMSSELTPDELVRNKLRRIRDIELKSLGSTEISDRLAVKERHEQALRPLDDGKAIGELSKQLDGVLESLEGIGSANEGIDEGLAIIDRVARERSRV